jgi:hypothetical protein
MDCGLEGLEKMYYNTNLATCYKKIGLSGTRPETIATRGGGMVDLISSSKKKGRS